MDLMHLFFSYHGRIRRKHYWLGGLMLLGCVFVLALAIVGIAFAATDSTAVIPLLAALILALYVFEMYVGLAISVKRAHDRDRSGWFVLAALIPVAGPIWILIELGLTDGTPGPNRFGPSPKGLGDPIVPVAVAAQ